MPDPPPGQGGRITLGGPGTAPQDQAKMEAAQKACQKILESVRPPELLLGGAPSPLGLLLQRAERSEVTLRLDDLFQR